MSSGGGTTQTSGEQNPWEPTTPYLRDILSQAENIYASDVGRNYFPGSTVVPFAPQTQQSLDLAQARSFDLMSPSTMLGTAGDAYTQAATGAMGSAYGTLTPQQNYLDSVREGITSDVMGDIATQFGGMGRTGTSPMAQQAAARGITQAYAPIQQAAAEAERERELRSSEAALGRRLMGAAGIPGIQQGMDQRTAAGIGQLGTVGQAYEDLAARQLQDQMSRYNFEQQSPYQRLAAYSQMVNPIGGMGYAGTSYQPDASPLMSGLTGAMLGGSIAGMPGMAAMGVSAPWMAGLGALGGITGLL
tara:strand:+ start:661 stop:1569 length:909 start_codon:yes stop_codon:yes gene_type:complete